MADVGNSFSTAAVFGASGGVGHALSAALAERGLSKIYVGSRSEVDWERPRFVPFRFDLKRESDLEEAARLMEDDPPELTIVASGVLTLDSGAGPERSYRNLDADTMLEVFALNTVAPGIIAKHIFPLLPRKGRSVFATLSARVGSISDNRLGGWHSYRASKAALNMLIRNFAIEMSRTHRDAVITALHPGTVDTALSAPFQSNLPEGQLQDPESSAAHLLDVIERLKPSDSGKVFDWKGQEIPA